MTVVPGTFHMDPPPRARLPSFLHFRGRFKTGAGRSLEQLAAIMMFARPAGSSSASVGLGRGPRAGPGSNDIGRRPSPERPRPALASVGRGTNGRSGWLAAKAATLRAPRRAICRCEARRRVGQYTAAATRSSLSETAQADSLAGLCTMVNVQPLP